MARGRNAKTEFKLNKADEQVLVCLAKTGVITNQLAVDCCGVGSKRMSRMEKEGIVKQKTYLENGKLKTCYKLTPEGNKFVKKNISCVRNIYKDVSKPNHDLILARAFLSLPVEARERAYTESDLIDRYGYGERGRDSTPDLYIPKLTVIIDNEEVTIEEQCIEAVTDRYGREQYIQKQNYIKNVMKKEGVLIEYVKAI